MVIVLAFAIGFVIGAPFGALALMIAAAASMEWEQQREVWRKEN